MGNRFRPLKRTLQEKSMTSEIANLIKRLDTAADADADALIESLVAAGPPAITPLALALADERRSVEARIGAADALAEIGQRHGEFARQCAAILRSMLERHLRNPIELNSAIVEHLVDLQARDAMAVIERAFVGGDVDSDFCDNLETIRRKLGVLAKPTSSPRPGQTQPSGRTPAAPQTPPMGRFAATPISEDSDEPLTFSAAGAFGGPPLLPDLEESWQEEVRPLGEVVPAQPFTSQPPTQQPPAETSGRGPAPQRPGFGARRALTPKERERLKTRRKQSRQARKKNRR